MKKLLIIFFMALAFVFNANAQSIEIHGNVTDFKDKYPLSGVTVTVVGQKDVYTVTDAEGNYYLTINSAAKQLKFVYLGYENVLVDITNSNVYDVTMKFEVEKLSEVVVTALGISREKKTLGYSVQEVSSEELTQNKSTSLINALQGKVAGVQIISGGSAMGASSRIVIRGNGGFSDNSPLWVVDGVPINSSSSSISVDPALGGADYGSEINDLDQNNIESITVLKGASASALYGSRALNGVIVVTTKQGDKRGASKIGVEVNSSFIGQVPSYYPKMQNEYGTGDWGDEYSYNNRVNSDGIPYKDIYSTYNEYLNYEIYRYVDGLNGIGEGGELSWGGRLDSGLFLDQWSTGPHSPYISRPDNIKYWFDNGYDIENNVSITSNTEKASGRFSYTNLFSKGIVPYVTQKQNTVSVNAILKPVKWLAVRADVTYLRKGSDNVKGMGYNYADIYAWRGRDYDVKYLRDLYEKEGKNECDYPESNNYFWEMDNIRQGYSRERIFGNISATFTITDWFNIVARYGIDSFLERRKNSTPSNSWDQIKINHNGTFGRSNYSFREDNADIFLNFDKTFGQFRIDGFLGGNYRYTYTQNESMNAPDLVVPDLHVMSNVKGTPGVGNSISRLKSLSVFFAVNTSYKDWLFLGFTGRNDWNSTLPKGNLSYFYPSLNLGFSITDAFGIKNDILTYAKPRFNIAQVGGATSAYRLQEVYGISRFNDIAIAYPADQLPPVNLKPQMATSWEIGADIRMFKNRLSFDLTYYERTTRNMIMSVPISFTTGYGSMLINAGRIFNRGFELIIGGKIFDNKNGFDWDLNFNLATNKNIVKKLYPGINQYEISNGYGGCTIVAEEGKEWGLLYGMSYLRNEEGEIINGKNGLPLTGSPKYLGKVTPDFTSGINTSFSYKRFALNAVFDMNFGNEFFSVTKWHSYPTGAYNNTVKGGIREKGYIGPGVIQQADGTYRPNDVRMSAEDYFAAGWVWNNHEYSILDGDYVKLRELTFSYEYKFKEIYPIKSITVALTCRNVAILYCSKECRELGIDPETQFGGGERGMGVESFNLPGIRAYGVRLNWKF